MRRQLPRTVLLQLAMPEYRAEFVKELHRRGEHLECRVGNTQFEATVANGVAGANVRHTGNNFFLLGRRFAWQRDTFIKGIRAQSAVLELNPRIINSWLIAIIRRSIGREVTAWGHAWPRSGRHAKSDRIRDLLRRLCNTLIVYTDEEAEALRPSYPNKRIEVAHNAIYSASDLFPSSRSVPGNALIWVGRLVPSKRPLLAVDVFERFMDRNIADASLVIVGAGPMLTNLKERVSRSKYSDRIQLTGPVFELEHLRDLFHSAFCLLATGYVGLNVTQALGFGIPVVYPLHEPHAPESSLLNAHNSLSFHREDVASGASEIESVWRARESYFNMREEISSQVRQRYSVEAMVEPFVSLRELSNSSVRL